MGLDAVPRAPRTPPPPVRREAVSVQRAAHLLDVHEMTVRRLVWAGKLKSFRVGSAVRIRLDTLIAYTKDQAG